MNLALPPGFQPNYKIAAPLEWEVAPASFLGVPRDRDRRIIWQWRKMGLSWGAACRGQARSGMVMDAGNRHRFSQADHAEWDAAISEFQRENRYVHSRPHATNSAPQRALDGEVASGCAPLHLATPEHSRARPGCGILPRRRRCAEAPSA